MKYFNFLIVFFADFKDGFELENEIEVVDFYQLICFLLQIDPQEHDGSWDRIEDMLVIAGSPSLSNFESEKMPPWIEITEGDQILGLAFHHNEFPFRNSEQMLPVPSISADLFVFVFLFRNSVRPHPLPLLNRFIFLEIQILCFYKNESVFLFLF